MDGSRSRWDLGLLMLGVAMVLASPHAHGQDLVLLVAAAAPVASRLWSERLPWPVALGSGLGWLLFCWLLPQQVLFGATLSSSVLLAAVFAGTLALIRTGRWSVLPGSPVRSRRPGLA
jgi:hypothetical protein